MSEPQIGQLAPDFSLPISDSKQVKLSEFRGKYVVLYFYPKDDTPGCTVEANDFNKLKADFEENNAIIIGISKDDLKSHDKFKAKYCLEFNLASDVDTKVCQKYGVWEEKSMYGKKYMGINRATFLIDPEGKIAHIWPKVSVEGHASEVLAKIKDNM